MVKKVFAVLFLSQFFWNARAQDVKTDMLLLQLDSVLEERGEYMKEKEEKTARLCVRRQELTDPEEIVVSVAAVHNVDLGETETGEEAGESAEAQS